MKFKSYSPALPALILPLLATAGAAQMVGTSHPDLLADGGVVQTDHYVKPAHDNDAVAPVQAAPAYVDSYPATGPAPVLLSRQGPPEAYSSLPTTPATGESAADIVRVSPPPVYVSATNGREQLVTDDPTSGVVMSVPMLPHQLIDGTLLKARLGQTIATKTTPLGTAFTAELLQDVGHHGEIMLPAGSVLHGRVTAIHGGMRLGGPASIRLQPQTVTLPDGTSYALLADVVEVEGLADTHVNEEGSIQGKTHPKATAAALGLTTLSAMAAGAVIGGGVGAAVGASIGAGVGAVWWLKREHQEILPAGTNLTFALGQSLTVSPR